MKQITQNYKTGKLIIEDVPLPLIKKGGVLVRNYYSVISAGTERATIEVSKKGYIGKAKEKPEQLKQVIQTAKKIGLKKTYNIVVNKLNTPVALGYSSSGTVLEVGDNAYGFQVGDRVACAGVGYANHAEVIFVPKNLCVKIPESVSFEEAAYTTLGAIALQGLRQAEVRLGERVVVIGLGLIGLLTVQLLKSAGCVVIGLDIKDYVIDHAKRNGADFAINSDRENAILLVESATQNVGADAVIITATSHSNKIIELAGELSRKKGTVVVLGSVKMDIPRSVYYGKELNLKLSCSYGPGRYDPSYEEHGIDYPISYVRWTERRNMETFLELLNERRINTGKITTHRFQFKDVKDAYDLITGKKEEKFIGLVLKYDSEQEFKPIVKVGDKKTKKTSRINICLIGAGNFAQSTILPAVKNKQNVSLEGILAAEGFLSKDVAKKFGIRRCFSEPDSIFKNKNINAIIVATRHNLHAHYVIESLKNHKHVYVEKPLAINERELKEVILAHKESEKDIMLGFNRRFAPLIESCSNLFSHRNSPMFISYRVNAGFIPFDHWTQSEEEGGGRIIGEVCHFMDLCMYICRSGFRSVFAQNIGGDKLRDNVSVLVKFHDGSVANISYLANGDNSYPKERIEIFCQNSIAVIDDFKSLEFIREGKREKEKRHQDKGHQKQISLWLRSIAEGTSIPVPFVESVNSSIATFMIHESLNKGEIVYFDRYSQKFFE